MSGLCASTASIPASGSSAQKISRPRTPEARISRRVILVGRVRVGMPDDRAEIGAEVKPLGVGALGKTCNNNFPASNAALGNTAAGSLPMLGGGLNGSMQHFILKGKDGVRNGTKIS
jgi:hypothetical protein